MIQIFMKGTRKMIRVNSKELEHELHTNNLHPVKEGCVGDGSDC
jgi:hypothetical protein